MPASPDLLALISQHNSRCVCKPSSGSSEYFFLYFGLHTTSHCADRSTERFYTNVVLGPPFTRDKLPFSLTFQVLHFVRSIEIAWRSQNSVSSAACFLQCPWRSRLYGFPNPKCRHNPITKQRIKVICQAEIASSYGCAKEKCGGNNVMAVP